MGIQCVLRTCREGELEVLQALQLQQPCSTIYGSSEVVLSFVGHLDVSSEKGQQRSSKQAKERRWRARDGRHLR